MSVNKFSKKSNRVVLDTQHLFTYIVYLKQAFDNINRPLDKIYAKAWINKLLEEPHPSHSKAIKRNTLLAQLLINLYDGKLEDPFTRMPANNSLELCDKLLLHDEPNTNVKNNIVREIFNKELTLDELNHTSSDERTYISIRSLENGTTLFGYVAITIGQVGEDPIWLNSKGEKVKSPVPSTKEIPVSSSVSEEIGLDVYDQSNDLDCLVTDVWNVLSRRKALEIRERANDLYQMLHNNIEEEMLMEQNKHSINCRDPYIEKLITFLIDDLKDKGVQSPKTFNKLNLLSMLKKNVKAVINEIASRKYDFIEIKNATAIQTMQLLPHPTANCQSFMSIMALQEALQGTINKKNIDLLCVQYPSCIIRKFKKMIKNEKLRTLQLIKIRFDNVTNEMYKDLSDSVIRGLRNYQTAREEWSRAWTVMKDHEKISKLITRILPTRSNEKTKDKFLESVENEIVIAQTRLKIANEKTDKLEKEISLLHKNIHELNEKYKLEKMHAEEQRNILIKERDNEMMDIQQRIATIKRLETMIDPK